MLERIKTRLSYANVMATVAFVVALAGSGLAVNNLISGNATADSAGATWFIGGSTNEVLGCLRCELSLPASGSSYWGTAGNTANDQLSPNVAIVARDLTVSVDVAPGDGATRTFTLYARGNAGPGLKCDITGANTTCNSGAQTYTISPGSPLFLDVHNSGARDGASARVHYSWRATTQ
jgi:hypothetical protein